MNPVQVAIEIETSGPLLAFDLLGGPKTLSVGAKASLPGGAVLRLHEMREHRAADFPTLLQLGLSFGTGAAASLAASWLYDKLKGRARALRIERMEVQIEEGQIRKVLVERIEAK